jgi:hypothetical protein
MRSKERGSQVLRTWSLELEQRNAEREQERVPERIDRLEDADVLDERLVPQEAP